jgi:hypothetical protein
MLTLEEQLILMKGLIRDAYKYQWYGNNLYIVHLIATQRNFDTLEMYENEDDWFLGQISCLGHDLIEDTYVTKDYLLEKGFDIRVVEAIDLVTKKDGLSYKDYLRKLSDNEIAWKVKVSDTYSNMTQSIIDCDDKRVRKYSSQLELLYKFKSWEE